MDQVYPCLLGLVYVGGFIAEIIFCKLSYIKSIPYCFGKPEHSHMFKSIISFPNLVKFLYPYFITFYFDAFFFLFHNS